MKKAFLLVLFLFSIAYQSHAQLLWEISGNGLEKNSYLYGTMHLGDERIYQFNDSLMPLFDKCDVFAGEIILEQSLMQSFGLLTQMQMRNDTTLRDLLPREEYGLVKRKLDKRLDAMGMLFFADMIERIKPVFVSMIMMDVELQSKGKVEKEPIDMFFQKIAKQKGMEVIGLETIKEQMDVFEKIPLKTQATMLYKELSSEKVEGENQLDDMIELYARQELDSLYLLTSTGMDSETNKHLLVVRNHNMADRMEPIMKKKPMFVGVGAAHLPGKEGVIDLLRKKGYTVRAVNFSKD
ncbi:MAG: hypothetical protein ACJAWV_001864 [Flammeovirgaceae bacterium]|jgi:uncharacterized protein YbaP (TraB family)